MSSDVDSLTEAQARIQAAFDPELVRAAGHQLADLLAGHFERIEASGANVLNWKDPRQNAGIAGEFLSNTDTGLDRDSLAEQFGSLVSEMLARGLNLHDPRYIGHQVPAPVPIAGLFDAVGSVTNQVMAIYEMGPWATSVERAMVEQLGQRIGWKKDEFAGLITHESAVQHLR